MDISLFVDESKSLHSCYQFVHVIKRADDMCKRLKYQKRQLYIKTSFSIVTPLNRPYRHQVSTMHHGSILGMSHNDISLRDSMKDVSLKDFKRC